VTTAALVDGLPSSSISLLDRGFLYGDSLFEALRTYGGQPAFLEEHLDRMAIGGRALGFEDPVPRAGFVEDVATLQAMVGADVVLRLYWTRGEGAGIAAAVDRGRRVSLAFPLATPSSDDYARGVRCVVAPGRATAFPPAKVPGYAVNVAATRAARAAGAHEALMEDELDRIEEGATSNLFAVVGGALVTAPTTRILAGITRAQILATAMELGVETHLRSPDRALLEQADELFLTSSIREVLPIRAVGDRALGDPGPLTRRLAEAYRARLPGGV
jgi:branched-chain amino acid aminotransferase